jgi:hypothetical protein
MASYGPTGHTIEAHLTDDGLDYLIISEGQFVGLLEAKLFERLFKPTEGLVSLINVPRAWQRDQRQPAGLDPTRRRA